MLGFKITCFQFYRNQTAKPLNLREQLSSFYWKGVTARDVLRANCQENFKADIFYFMYIGSYMLTINVSEHFI